MHISDYLLGIDGITFLDATTREDALSCLVDLFVKNGKVESRSFLYEAILKREKIASTGIGMNVAIPHAKTPLYPEFSMVLGMQKQGIAWDSLDGSLVKIIFMIIGPDNRQTECLRLLSKLTEVIKNEELRTQMFHADSSASIWRLLKDY